MAKIEMTTFVLSEEATSALNEIKRLSKSHTLEETMERILGLAASFYRHEHDGWDLTLTRGSAVKGLRI